MNQHKRQLSYNYVLKEGIKKFQYELDQKTISITSIESLSNEFFYEIFDYLDGRQIYQAFHNLNHRFQQLINSSSLLFKIKQESYVGVDFINNCKQIIHLNRHQIFSIYLELPFRMNEFSLPFTIDSSLTRLESLVLIDMQSSIFWPILFKLICLPRLFSLTIKMTDSVTDLTNIYQKILSLPVLKYYKCSVRNSNTSLFLPIATDKQFSSIENLVIDHCCDFEQLATIISYTPQLIRLSFKHIKYNLENNEIIVPITLTNLTHLSLYVLCMEFDEFELLINDIYSKIKVLSFTTEFEDINYLDGNRWEQFILKKFPQLEKFYFKYYEDINYVNRSPEYFDKRDQFISSFWIERQWLFEVELVDRYIVFSIRPHKNQWYEYETQRKIVDSSTQLAKSSRLTITLFTRSEYLIIDINRILTLAQIYHFEISEYNVFIGILTHITNSLRELESLKIHSLSSRRPQYMNDDEFVPIYSTSYTNKIKKVYLVDMNTIEDFHMILNFSPYMEYLEVEYINDEITEEFLQIILKKINHEHNDHLRSLCLHVRIFNDDNDNNTYGNRLIKKLQTIINSKNLLMNYTIKRIVDNIYLEWK